MNRDTVLRALALSIGAFGELTTSGCAGFSPAATFATASANAAINPAGGSISFPVAGGYGGTFVYSANDAPPNTSAALLTTTRRVGIPGPQPPGAILVSFEFTLSQSVKFADWHELLTTITIPATIPTSGRSLYEYGYDLTKGIGIGINPGTVSGTSIVFRSGGGPVTLTADTYLLVLVIT